MKSWVGTKNFVFCIGYNALTLAKNIQKRYLSWRVTDTIQAHTRNGSRSDFPYYNLTSPNKSRGLALFTIRERSDQLVGFQPWKPSSVLRVLHLWKVNHTEILIIIVYGLVCLEPYR